MKEFESDRNKTPLLILPHHAISLFRVAFLKIPPEEVVSYYDDDTMKAFGVKLFRLMLSNPDQEVKMVDTNDCICEKCPKNKNGDNFKVSESERCKTYDVPDSNIDIGAAGVLGIKNLVGKTTTVSKLLEAMVPTFHRLLNEGDRIDENSKEVPLGTIFRYNSHQTQDRLSFVLREIKGSSNH